MGSDDADVEEQREDPPPDGDSRDLRHKNPNLDVALRITCALVGLFLFVTGFIGMREGVFGLGYEFMHALNLFIKYLYSMIFGLLVTVLVLRWESLLKNFAFMHSFIGRGIFYVLIGIYFMGISSLNASSISTFTYENWLGVIAAIAITFCGVVYIVLGVTPMYSDDHDDFKVKIETEDALVSNFETLATVIRIVSLAVGVFLSFTGGYYVFNMPSFNFGALVVNLYSIVFGVLVCLSALRIESFLWKFGFITTFIGRGLFYIFVGGFFYGLMDKETADFEFVDVLVLIAATAITINGFIYVVFWVLPGSEFGGCLNSGGNTHEKEMD